MQLNPRRAVGRNFPWNAGGGSSTSPSLYNLTRRNLTNAVNRIWQHWPEFRCRGSKYEMYCTHFRSYNLSIAENMLNGVNMYLPSS